MKKCEVEDCYEEGKTAGLCGKHYYRKYTYGSPHVSVSRRQSPNGKTCTECDSRDNILHINGSPYCKRHYEQIRKYGEVKRTRFDKNEIIPYEDYAEIVLYDKNGIEKGRTMISKHRIPDVSEIKWRISNSNYVSGSINRKSQFLHRFILKPSDTEEVDHINGNPLDNRDDNLRVCTGQQNKLNTRAVGGTSKHKGVTVIQNQNQKVYMVQFRTGFGKLVRTFSSEIAAVNFYNHLCKIYKDAEFCRYNDVPYLDLEQCYSHITNKSKMKFSKKES